MRPKRASVAASSSPVTSSPFAAWYLIRARLVLGPTMPSTGPASNPAAFKRHGLDMRTPPVLDRGLVDRVIFEELCQGVINPASRAEYVRIIAELKDEGCDAVALSCTEIPLLVDAGASPLPTLDSTRLLAREAVAVALGETPVPDWRGGAMR